MERPVTLYECRQAIHRLGLAKSAGPDGLPAEFYKSFEELVVRDLHNTFLEAHNLGTLPSTMREGDIVLLYVYEKGDSRAPAIIDPSITLLQIDYKILAKILVARMKKTVNNFVSKEQLARLALAKERPSAKESVRTRRRTEALKLYRHLKLKPPGIRLCLTLHTGLLRVAHPPVSSSLSAVGRAPLRGSSACLIGESCLSVGRRLGEDKAARGRWAGARLGWGSAAARRAAVGSVLRDLELDGCGRDGESGRGLHWPPLGLPPPIEVGSAVSRCRFPIARISATVSISSSDSPPATVSLLDPQPGETAVSPIVLAAAPMREMLRPEAQAPVGSPGSMCGSASAKGAVAGVFLGLARTSGGAATPGRPRAECAGALTADEEAPPLALAPGKALWSCCASADTFLLITGVDCARSTCNCALLSWRSFRASSCLSTGLNSACSLVAFFVAVRPPDARSPIWAVRCTVA
eukprot:scaffold795_cov115-Isochrysis_galbana.AAC.7